jgi:hypothetical protein
MMRRHALLSLALAGFAGCAGLQGPGYVHPGTAQYQQNQAQRFDPFPATDVGPDMAARPLAYMRPAPENERVQNVDSYMKRYHQPPPVEQYRPPRTMVAPPPPGVFPTAVETTAPPWSGP